MGRYLVVQAWEFETLPEGRRSVKLNQACSGCGLVLQDEPPGIGDGVEPVQVQTFILRAHLRSHGPAVEDNMNIAEFEATFALQALWWDARGHWDRAHALAQVDEEDRQCAWVHAYLHRKEGDLSNAAYWYRRAGQPVADSSLSAEWRVLAKAVLSDP
jgi:hypothetical protein